MEWRVESERWRVEPGGLTSIIVPPYTFNISPSTLHSSPSTQQMSILHIRRAVSTDQAVLVDFNCKMAWETEHKRLDEATVLRGVGAVFADPAKGFYIVAEKEGEVIGQLMITTEWSDWRDGWFWWIQSVYVCEKARRSGVFRSLFEEILRLGREAGNIVGIRLYVEKDNLHAQRTYQSLGMKEGPYLLFERSPLSGMN